VGPWDLEASLIPHDYVRAVEEAGGRPLLVPPSENGLEETLDALDRIVFSGGSDLDPEHYGGRRIRKRPASTGSVTAPSSS
jgi:gamma-glutamyl-gamma-aminobutyrate hydrolase PuuD